jgi:hypothetical protein
LGGKSVNIPLNHINPIFLFLDTLPYSVLRISLPGDLTASCLQMLLREAIGKIEYELELNVD